MKIALKPGKLSPFSSLLNFNFAQFYQEKIASRERNGEVEKVARKKFGSSLLWYNFNSVNKELRHCVVGLFDVNAN